MHPHIVAAWAVLPPLIQHAPLDRNPIKQLKLHGSRQTCLYVSCEHVQGDWSNCSAEQQQANAAAAVAAIQQEGGLAAAATEAVGPIAVPATEDTLQVSGDAARVDVLMLPTHTMQTQQQGQGQLVMFSGGQGWRAIFCKWGALYLDAAEQVGSIECQ